MASDGTTDSSRPAASVFLSYASEDRPAARLIRDYLCTFGLEVWYDENELDGGDAWDRKIRRQIRECDYFMPMISATTQARHEGYFRREWRLAVERTLDMADDHTFLLPVVIDDTDQAAARVPEKFLAVQWIRVPAGQPTPALQALCRRIAAGKMPGPALPPPKAPDAPSSAGSPPLAEPGQRLPYWLEVSRWAFRSARMYFMKLPRWVRIGAYFWLFVVVIARGCDSKSPPHAAKVSPATAEKLKTIADQYRGSSNKDDIAKLGKQIAREFADPDDDDDKPSPLLAIPFSARAGDSAADKLADSTFAQVYGRVAISHHGQVELSKDPLPSPDLKTALERGRANNSRYVLWGAVDTQGSEQMLTVKLAVVADGSVLWSNSYSASGADPAKIANDVESILPSDLGASH